MKSKRATIKGVFWDNDGVLVDTEHLYYRATIDVLRQAGFELTREQFIEATLKQGTSPFALAERELPAGQVSDLRQARDDLYADLLAEKNNVIAGVEETLRSMHGRVRMAVVTSSRRRHFEIIHRHSGLLRYFDFVLTREDYARAKPHPEPYLQALSRSGLQPGECVAVEDSERGLAAARAAGLRCLVIPGELTCTSDFSTADQVLAGVREVPAALF
jgi:HAD superfamily hydrolase (TIGR01509 family)